MRNNTAYINKVKAHILSHLNSFQHSATIYEASKYSIEAGGKGLRPLLLFTALDALGTDLDQGISAASAIEMIHTYSLIHDDLPAMDNDELRRGKPTNHIVFGEAAAILAGDNLLNESFNVIAKDQSLSAEVRIELVETISDAAGQSGMISGQMLDIEAEMKTASLDELETIHTFKTGALIKAPVTAACIIAGADEDIQSELERFSEVIGVLFQIKDDILDLEGNPELTGKNTGSDEKKGKVTYVSELGIDGAKQALRKKEEEAYSILNKLDDSIAVSGLREIVQMFAQRDQ
ncbi:Farnesyl diphosphate synthase [Jeotgalicoccus aerolatus]|uniref:Geranylgeranyl diphosphate synthase type II n=1 Tax=Jeotgalicoccus aerolatus TaxID=709510 RepID=A0ABS4HLL2_9STAP|nr:farnesyl diphosphate synthase [Jeotgalicoccus aerolatus]MBP1951743.1 geranylgeranyl diphosphate synthase type II [Jeotgalicoccus aerolatus]GGD95143.1 geranyltranstransferase [Jeotgalicoccus aerolatus]CAD2075404.1 Farnesyl diphosphate synthase [Jeotgalicoccus aerolatus]